MHYNGLILYPLKKEKEKFKIVGHVVIKSKGNYIYKIDTKHPMEFFTGFLTDYKLTHN